MTFYRIIHHITRDDLLHIGKLHKRVACTGAGNAHPSEEHDRSAWTFSQPISETSSKLLELAHTISFRQTSGKSPRTFDIKLS